MSKRFSASSAAQLMACPGSANLELAIPGWTPPVVDEMKGAKGEGTLIHAFIDEMLGYGRKVITEMEWLVAKLADTHYKKRRLRMTDVQELDLWLVDEYPGCTIIGHGALNRLAPLEMIPPKLLHFAADALLYFLELTRRGVDSLPFWSELSMECLWLPSRPRTTVDLVVYDLERREIHVVDWKTGKIPVSPVDNDQLMFYATSVIEDLWSSLWETGKGWSVSLHIVQPDQGPQKHVITIEDLLQWRARALFTDDQISRKVLLLRPNEHCTFCPANPQSRGDKAAPYCPPMLSMLYPPIEDTDALLEI